MSRLQAGMIGCVVGVVLAIGVLGIISLAVRSDEEMRQSQYGRANWVASNLIYFRDKKTGLCYAYSGRNDSLIPVPYENVKDYLVNPSE